MAGLTHDQKRAFIHRMIEILEENQDVLAQAGFDVQSRIDQLKQKWAEQEQAEAEQLQALALYKEKTELSVEKLSEAYKLASATVELIVGILGKDHPLVEVIKNIRDEMALEAQRGKKKSHDE